MKTEYSLVSTEEVYENPWMSIREDKVQRSDGSSGLFGVVTMKPGSTILAVTRELDVYVTREYKYGIGQESVELVSGALNESESALDAAKRELEEEIGYQAERWIDCGYINPFTTVINSPNYLFLALDLRKTEQNLDDGEYLEFERIPLQIALEMVTESKITHGASCVLILKAYNILKNEGII